MKRKFKNPNKFRFYTAGGKNRFWPNGSPRRRPEAPTRHRYGARPLAPRDNRRPAVFGWLMDNLMGDNGGKLLEQCSSAGNYFWQERDRAKEDEGGNSYYEVRARGNCLRAYRIRWTVNDTGLNLYMTSLTGLKEKDPEPVFERVLLVERPLREWREFAFDYKRLTPALRWFRPQFMYDAIRGMCSPGEDIDDYIDRWHALPRDADFPVPELHDELGLDREDYERWAKDPESLPDIISEYRAAYQRPMLSPAVRARRRSST